MKHSTHQGLATTAPNLHHLIIVPAGDTSPDSLYLSREGARAELSAILSRLKEAEHERDFFDAERRKVAEWLTEAENDRGELETRIEALERRTAARNAELLRFVELVARMGAFGGTNAHVLSEARRILAGRPVEVSPEAVAAAEELMGEQRWLDMHGTQFGVGAVVESPRGGGHARVRIVDQSSRATLTPGSGLVIGEDIVTGEPVDVLPTAHRVVPPERRAAIAEAAERRALERLAISERKRKRQIRELRRLNVVIQSDRGRAVRQRMADAFVQSATDGALKTALSDLATVTAERAALLEFARVVAAEAAYYRHYAAISSLPEALRKRVEG